MKSSRRAKAAGFSLAVFILCGFGSCNLHHTWRDNTFAKRDVKHSPTNVELPEKLWEKIADIYRKIVAAKEAEVNQAAGKEGDSNSLTAEHALPTGFAPLKVFLIEKNKGILHGENYEIDFGPGGGEIDLADFVQPLNGSFYFAVEFLPEAEVEIEKHVFFLSNGVMRRNSSETVGAGCDTYFDVSHAFANAMIKDGFLLNTSDQRHVSALAGTYFFAAVQGATLQLASLTIRDSTHRSLECRR
jgi:hypothetical protein